MRGNAERKAVAKALASGKAAKKSAAKKKAAKPWNASWAACGDGCLDKLVVSVKKEPPITRPLRGGLVEFPAVPAASGGGGAAPLVPLVLLGLLSGSPTRRAMLRCTWTQVPRFHETVRLLFVVGSNSPGQAVADELRVNVTEGERMRASNPSPNPNPNPNPVPNPDPDPDPDPDPNPNPNPNPNPRCCRRPSTCKSRPSCVTTRASRTRPST